MCGAAGDSLDWNDVNGDFSIAGTASVTRENGAGKSGKSANGVQVVHLPRIRRVSHRAVVRVPNSEGVIHRRNLVVDRCVKDPVATTNDRLVVAEWIPRGRDSRAKIFFVCVQRSVLRVKLIAKAEIQGQIGPDLPRVLKVARRERPCVIRVNWIAKALLENDRDAKRSRLQRSYTGTRQLRANRTSRQRTKHETPREERVRFRMVAAKQLGTSEFESMVPANQREVVRDFISARNAGFGQKDVRSQIIHKAWDLESGFPRFVRNYASVIEVKLQPEFVLSGGAELMIKSGQNVVVIGAYRAARRKARERLYVGIFLAVMPIPVSDAYLVRIAESVIEPPRRQVLSGVVR